MLARQPGIMLAELLQQAQRPFVRADEFGEAQSQRRDDTRSITATKHTGQREPSAKLKKLGQKPELSFSKNASVRPAARAASGPRRTLFYLEMFCRFLAAIGDNLVLNVLAFVERAQPGPLDRGDVNEHILAAALRLDKAVTFGRVEPLHSACSHSSVSKSSENSPSLWCSDASPRPPLHRPTAPPPLSHNRN
jgi:hypothetical protein